MLFDIDWQGTQQLRQQAGDDLVSVFVLPPSHAELERRLRVRAQDAEEVVRARMAKANDEISHWAEYDYVVINDDHPACARNAGRDIAGGTHEARPPTGLAQFVRNLMREG